MNAANEVAVHRFLNKEIDYISIPKIVEKSLEKLTDSTEISLNNLINIDKEQGNTLSVLINYMDFIDILQTIGIFVGALMILVFIHELGHFLAAKAFGMRVERFSVGFHLEYGDLNIMIPIIVLVLLH